MIIRRHGKLLHESKRRFCEAASHMSLEDIISCFNLVKNGSLEMDAKKHPELDEILKKNPDMQKEVDKLLSLYPQHGTGEPKKIELSFDDKMNLLAPVKMSLPKLEVDEMSTLVSALIRNADKDALSLIYDTIMNSRNSSKYSKLYGEMERIQKLLGLKDIANPYKMSASSDRVEAKNKCQSYMRELGDQLASYVKKQSETLNRYSKDNDLGVEFGAVDSCKTAVYNDLGLNANQFSNSVNTAGTDLGFGEIPYLAVNVSLTATFNKTQETDARRITTERVTFTLAIPFENEGDNFVTPEQMALSVNVGRGTENSKVPFNGIEFMVSDQARGLFPRDLTKWLSNALKRSVYNGEMTVAPSVKPVLIISSKMSDCAHAVSVLFNFLGHVFDRMLGLDSDSKNSFARFKTF